MPDTPVRTTSHLEPWPVTGGNLLEDEDPVSAEELAVLQEQPLGDITALSTPAGVFTYVSAASLATLGWEPAELVGRMGEEYVHPEDLPAVLTSCDAALRSSVPSTAPFRFRGSDGDYL